MESDLFSLRRAENVRVFFPKIVADDVTVELYHPAPFGRSTALRLHLDLLSEYGSALAELLGLIVVVHAKLGEEDLVFVLGEAAF